MTDDEIARFQKSGEALRSVNDRWHSKRKPSRISALLLYRSKPAHCRRANDCRICRRFPVSLRKEPERL